MSSDGPHPDGGVAKEDIFGTGESVERTRVPPAERLRRMLDFYLYAPLAVAWEDWRTRIGGLGILFYLAMGIVGPYVVGPVVLNEGPRYLGAFVDMSLPLGTDNIGRSVFKLIVHATPPMLQMALAGITFTIGLGVIFGVVAGYKGGSLDRAMMTLTDIVIVLPGLPLIFIIASIYSPTDPFLVGAILAIDQWPGLARALRSQVLTLRETEFVEAARAMGLGTPTIVGQELLPKLAPYMLISAANAARGVIQASVALYFLGILPRGQVPNWGLMMNQAYETGNAISSPSTAGHWLFFPLLALMGLTFTLVLFSQGLDRVFNPRLRARHARTTPARDDEEEVL